MGKIPTIVVGDTVITEAPAIIAWLADAYPKAALAPPPGSRERGTYYRWLFFGGSCIEPAMVDEMFKRPPPERKSAFGWGSYNEVIDTIEKALQPGPYLLGDKFSGADVYIGAQMMWGGMFGAPRLKESRPSAPMSSAAPDRPAYRRTQEQEKRERLIGRRPGYASPPWLSTSTQPTIFQVPSGCFAKA